MGKVFLVGAGPGSIDLLTRKAERLLRKADCIVYDRLIEDAILDLASDDCEMIYVGKQAGNHTMKQDAICDLLVEKAKQYDCVVRLKGGDVYVFGRGGEEGIKLYENHIPFEVVPGVTSAIAGLAYAGIPITHRGMARGFHVVTAHDKDDKLANMDFDAMARTEDTCVFLMGLSKVGEIAEKLLEAGKNPNTPAAIISHATWISQQVIEGTLSTIDQKLKEHPLPSPALFVVGNVISLRKELSFLEQRPLHGCKILLAHPKGNGTMPSLFHEQGALVKELYSGEIQYRKDALSDLSLSDYTHIVCTSRHGAKALCDYIYKERIDLRNLSEIKLCCVGKKTAAVFEEHMLYADIIPDSYDGESLADCMEKELKETDQVLFLSGKMYHKKLRSVLETKAKLTHRFVYENVKNDVDTNIKLSDYDIMVFTCSSAVDACAELLRQDHLPYIISMGKETSATLCKYGIEDIHTANISTAEEIIQMVIDYWRN